MNQTANPKGKPGHPVVLLALAVLAACFGVAGVSNITDGMRSRGWRQTPCVVTQFEYRSHVTIDSRRGTRRQGQYLVKYEYEFGGRKFESSPVSFGDASVDSPPPGLKQGQATVCYVNPANPAEAVLQTGAQAGAWLLTLLGLGSAAALVVWAGVESRRRRLARVAVPASEETSRLAA